MNILQLLRKIIREISKGEYRKVLDTHIEYILSSLVEDQTLNTKHKNHDLSDNWLEYCESYIKPDLSTIYSKTCKIILRLVCLGSHSNLYFNLTISS